AYLSGPSRDPTASYALSLHDALPISRAQVTTGQGVTKVAGCDSLGWDWLPATPRCPTIPCITSGGGGSVGSRGRGDGRGGRAGRSEEHTSELQSRSDIVCRLLLEKKK